MGSSFVLFDVSMEITLGQFRSGKSGYTQNRVCPWANAIYPWVKGLACKDAIVVFVFFVHQTNVKILISQI